MNSTMMSSPCSKVLTTIAGSEERHHDAPFAGLAAAKIDVLDTAFDASGTLRGCLAGGAAGAIEGQYDLIAVYVDGVGARA